MDEHSLRITEVTRRNIFDRITLEKCSWSGRLDESDFLARLYDLNSMPSTDHRFADTAGDIWQHRVRNWDWEPDWVFTDSRFNLLRCPDEELLGLLCETLHPVVQPDSDVVYKMLDIYNAELRRDGFQIVEKARISERPIFAARETQFDTQPALAHAKALGEALTADSLMRQISRMEAAIHEDPELAIGTAKELIETGCKTILAERGKQADAGWSLPKLVRETTVVIDLIPEGVTDQGPTADIIRRTLASLGQLAQGAAELRNLHGTGHGKDGSSQPLPPHHARLAVNAASALIVFLLETHGMMQESESTK